ncbi:MAG: 30S ribosomal protein S2 [Candidatus Jacksonbacteria bacterium RIFOXYC2_FULL_44_29]|nr:MAG: 30S ribosomal protein S2 [Parcubacteria group bacterium GW2011_GWC2_44_22]OGY75747.1 MAG: 30S ribosomal protein S2 [Candidatus Jacksonbacteria bacterium RIFOXYA2_FULL_43_12]OGY76318.1 MAG: 30S ribosomal protein S2 [Candidatus Jacksonbacteria bacterium RIFOXYB2_FULL_44_15]OGY78145.1 MAG: 30S ribosomal protein S2 [Candidatus Jacksonbacteria bacterium RIFOXYC2_FULL_44_29]OGY80981.1 MAG: 30S ribosomal protein S2 [Candidatus Jacksonbacteria bacterium RIFOXYD2_FULL_43_21]HBH46726.1 30S ribos
MQLPEITELLKSGVHFGHKTAKWHPSMEKFIFGERKGVHIIDLAQTLSALEEAIKFINQIIAKNGVILFVGAKEQASELIRKAALEMNMPYIGGKWIGGTITNWPIIKKQILKLRKTRDEKEKGEWSKYTKKERVVLEHMLKKLDLLYSGLVNLDKTPDALFIADCKENKTALREANLKNIPVIALTDTNVNIRKISHPIPANDDAVKSLELLINVIKSAVIEAKQNTPQSKIIKAENIAQSTVKI